MEKAAIGGKPSLAGIKKILGQEGEGEAGEDLLRKTGNLQKKKEREKEELAGAQQQKGCRRHQKNNRKKNALRKRKKKTGGRKKVGGEGKKLKEKTWRVQLPFTPTAASSGAAFQDLRSGV